MTRSKDKSAPAAMLALLSIAYFVSVLIALHFLDGDHDPIADTTSAYVNGPHGALMTSAFPSAGLAVAALLIALPSSLDRAARSTVGQFLLGAWCVGTVIAMIFPLDPSDVAPTLAGRVHRINGPIAFLCLSVGALLVSRNLGRDSQWRRLSRRAFALAAPMPLLALLVGVNIRLDTGFAGALQRVVLVIFGAWVALVATHSYKLARDRARPPCTSN